MGIIVELALTFVMEVIMYGIGRAAIAVLSLGRARAEGFTEILGTNHRSDGTADTRFVVPVLATQLIGIAAFTAAVTLLFALQK